MKGAVVGWLTHEEEQAQALGQGAFDEASRRKVRGRDGKKDAKGPRPHPVPVLHPVDELRGKWQTISLQSDFITSYWSPSER
eukprot:scaffold659850_cov86-Prasinocladus_malaysianus.AAC.1